MTEISTNSINSEKPVIKSDTSIRQNVVSRPSAKNRISYDEFWRREKRKNNGLIERLYNKIKNLTGLGVGSKRVETAILQAKNKQISPNELRKTVQNYHTSQENAAQLLGDAASIGAAGFTYFWLSKKLKFLNAKIKLNEDNAISGLKLLTSEKFAKKIIGIGKSNSKVILTTAGAAGIIGGLAKYWMLKFNRVGSGEFKVDEKMHGKKSQRNKYQKYLEKESKRVLRRERHKTNFKNFVSGAINGLMMPLMMLGGIIGAPIYLIANSLNRYFVANKTDKNKSIDSYINNLSKDAITIGLTTAGIAIPLVKKGNYIKLFNENIKKATDKLSKAELKKPDYTNISAFSELEATLLGSEKIANILHDNNIPIEEKITKLTEENIFAVKFKQISGDNSPLTSALREKCPATRTLKEAQNYVDSKIGTDYKIKQLLGVGTIAETYLAKDKNGKDVCLKVLKDGISKEKILKDKENFIILVKSMKDKSDDEKNYLLRNINDLSDGILKEVDFNNELEAAKALMPHTRVANVVKPIEVRNGIYIMEKAEGISLSSLVDLNEAKLYKEGLAKNSMMHGFYEPKKGTKLYYELQQCKTKKEKLAAIDAYIKRIESRTPQFDSINLSKNDANYLVKEYMKVLVEQFHKMEKNGKILHADIHPGNIFIDMNALRARKGKIFTLIDTGNTIEQSAEQSLRAINLTKYVNRGNVKDLTDYVLEGAILPKGMSKEDAVKKISEELKKCFFDDKTKLDIINNDSVLTLTSNIMRKYNIIPSDTQLNLNKAKRSADNSLYNMLDTLASISMKDIDGGKSAMSAMGGLMKDALILKKQYNKMKSIQEKLNLKELPLAEQVKYKKNPNILETNSEDYLTYKLKQGLDKENIKILDD